MRKTPSQAPNDAAVNSTRRGAIIDQIKSVQASVASASEAVAGNRTGLDAVLRQALDCAAQADEADAFGAPVADVVLDIALGAADAAYRQDTGAADASKALVAALPLGGRAEAAMSALLEATVALLRAADEGDYSIAGAIYRERLRAVEAAFPESARRGPHVTGSRALDRIISVAA